MFRDAAMDKGVPVAMAVKGPSGHTAIAFNVLPDFRPTKVNLKVKQSPISKLLEETGVDFDPQVKYDVESDEIC